METEANDLPQESQGSGLKTVQKENMDDLVQRTMKKKPVAEDIAKISRSEAVTQALHQSLTTP